MYRYENVVDRIQRWIESGVLKPGDRVPSVRDMSEQTGFSAVTVHHAYALLESDGIVRASPRSGFYVASSERKLSEFPASKMDYRGLESSAAPVSESLGKLIYTWRKNRVQTFGNNYPSDDLMPSDEIRTHLIRALREETRWSIETASTDGDPKLREIIAKRAAQRGMDAVADDVIVTRSAQCALNLCLDAVTKPGETVLIESPSYYPMFDALRRRGLRVMEIYSHPTTGLDPDQFEYLLGHNKIAACLLTPVNHFPTGVTYSPDTLRRIVSAASRHAVPIIENDLFGEMSHRAPVASTLKRFDTDHNVLQFGSFAGTLGPRFGIGWLLSRRHRAEMLNQTVLGEPLGVDAALQRAIAQYMNRRSYDRHLRQLRESLASRMQQGLSLISKHFPLSCAVSRPAGGFTCWIRGPKEFDAMRTAEVALRQGVSIPPGPMFSVTGSFRNFLSLNLSYPWDATRQKRLQMLAEMMSEAPR